MRLNIYFSAILAATITFTCMAGGLNDGDIFFYDFSDRGESAFATDWSVIDTNNDGISWEYSPWVAGIDGDEGTAVCYGGDDEDTPNNDYLISQPVRLTEGDNHISFYTKASYIDRTERLEMYYLESNDIAEMTLIGATEFSGPDWKAHIYNFKVPEAGYYRIALRDCSVGGIMTCIDNVSIGNGYKPTSPQLHISRLLLPVSNCDLSDQCRIGAIINNTGTKHSEHFTLTYEINGGQQKVDEEFNVEIAPNECKVVYFSQPADFSDVGEHTVNMYGCHDYGNEIECHEGHVNTLIPTTLPLVTDFSEGTLGQWTEIEPGSWTFDTFFGYFQGEPGGIDKGLISQCFEAETSVRIKISYGVSNWGEGKMHIALGKAGCDYHYYNTVYTDDGFSGSKEVEFECELPENDHYCIILINDETSQYGEPLLIHDISINKVKDNDLAIVSQTACLSSYTPIEQLTNETPIKVTVANRGLNESTGFKAIAYCGSNIVGEVDFSKPLQPRESADIEIKADLSHVAIDDVLVISVVIEGYIADEYTADNIISLPDVHVTSTLRANEHTTDFDLGVGSWGDTLCIGNIYSLACDDILTAIDIAFTETDDIFIYDKDIAVLIYELGDDLTVSRNLFSQTVKRGAGGLMHIDVDPMLLHKGYYFFAVAQLTNSNMGLAYEYGENNVCYQYINGNINCVSNGLSLVIRAIFDDAYAPAYDVALLSIVTPKKEKGLYSDKQKITAIVKNLGHQDAVFSIVGQVNGQKITEQLHELMPYETSTYDFGSYDMSVPGNYIVELSTDMPNDEVLTNDSIIMTYTAEEEESPYMMDFEACTDFDGMNETFNPRWRTVDRNNCTTDAFWAYSYPYHGQSAGFIAFNPDKTVPSMTEMQFPGFTPHSGARFGAAFATDFSADNIEGRSDVWLISPMLQLYTGSSLQLYVKTRALEWDGQPLEKYQILISDTDDDFESFNVLGDEIREAPADDWECVEFDLSDYDNKRVYIAVRYIGIAGKNVVFMIDDITVKTNMGQISDVSDGQFEISFDGNAINICAPCAIEYLGIHDIYGREIFSATDSKNRHTVSTDGIDAGIYIVTATSHHTHSTAKVLIK